MVYIDNFVLLQLFRRYDLHITGQNQNQRHVIAVTLVVLFASAFFFLLEYGKMECQNVSQWALDLDGCLV